MAERDESRPGPWGYVRLLGPGLAIAATGVGAGDLVAASVSGARYGFAVAWAAVLGALLKFVLNEGLARWQLSTGTTLLEGWARYLGRWVQYLFLGYLVVWSYVVAAALMSACGLAAHAMAPWLSVNAWAVIHSVAATLMVLFGGYGRFERLIKIFVAIMFVTLVGSALWVDSPVRSLTRTVTEATVPRDGVRYILGVIGGVGGSVTLLSYGYWIREKGWNGKRWLSVVRFDLLVAYGLTGLFGLAVMVLAAHALHAEGKMIEGSRGVIQMASMLEGVAGRVGVWTFLVGFWGAVATSMIGVWQGVPYLFCDFVRVLGRSKGPMAVDVRSRWYRGYLFWLAGPPILLLFAGRPVPLIVAYTVMGALFMPFLAATLLWLNRRIEPELRNGWPATLLLVVCLALFGYIGLTRLWNPGP